MAVISSLVVKLSLEAQNFNNALRTAQTQLKQIEKTIAPTTKALDAFGNAARSMGLRVSVAVSAPIAALTGLGIAFNAMEEQAQMSFTTLLGDGQKAKNFLGGLKDFAAKTPFEFGGLVKASQRMLAMGFEADKLVPTLTAVGDAAAAMGGSQDTIDRIVLALGQMQARGKVSTQEMNQLTEAGINGWKMLGESIGVSQMKLRDMVEKGVVPSGKAVEVLIAGMNRDFGGMMAKQSTTFQGLMSTLKDETRMLAGEMTKGLFDFIKPKMQNLVDSVSGLRKGFEALPDSIKAAAGAFLVIGSAAGPALLGVGEIAFGINNVISLLALMKVTSLASFGAMAIAAGAVGATIAGLGIVIVATAKRLESLRDDPKKLAESISTIPAGSGPVGAAVAAGNVYNAARGLLFPEAPQTPGKLLPGGLPPEAQAAFAAGDPEIRKANEEFERHMKQWELLAGSANKTKAAVDPTTASIDQMWKSLQRESVEAAALEGVLMRADAAHISTHVILEKLGPKIAEAAEESRLYGATLDPVTAKYARMLPLLKLGADHFQMQADGLKAIAETTQSWNPEILTGGLSPDLLKMPDFAPLSEEFFKGSQVQRTIDEATQSLKNQKAEAEHLAVVIRQLANDGKTFQQIEDGLGVSIAAVAEKTKDQALVSMVAADTLRNSWGAAFGAISDQLVDMIVDFDFSFKRLGDIAKSTAKSLLGSFLDGFLKPFKDGLSSLGEGLASTLSGALFGGGKGQQGGGLFSGIGGALGGLFGKGGGLGGMLGGIFGGGPGAGDYTRMPMPGGGGAGGLMSAGMSSAMGFASVGASLIGPIGQALSKIGAGRDSANEIVKSQNAFEQTLNSILNDSSLSATNKMKMVDNVWGDYQANLARFSAAGGEGGVTANQSFATLSPLISQIKSDLTKEGAVDGSGGGGGHTFNINVTVPPGSDGEGIAQMVWDVINRNLAGATDETARQVQLRGAAVLSR